MLTNRPAAQPPSKRRHRFPPRGIRHAGPNRAALHRCCALGAGRPGCRPLHRTRYRLPLSLRSEVLCRAPMQCGRVPAGVWLCRMLQPAGRSLSRVCALPFVRPSALCASIAAAHWTLLRQRTSAYPQKHADSLRGAKSGVAAQMNLL